MEFDNTGSITGHERMATLFRANLYHAFAPVFPGQQPNQRSGGVFKPINDIIDHPDGTLIDPLAELCFDIRRLVGKIHHDEPLHTKAFNNNHSR